MKVLLVKPPEPQKTEKNISGRIIEHLGLGYIASVLRVNGIDTEILDARIQKIDMGMLRDDILGKSFDLIGVSMPYQWSIPEVLPLIRELRQAGMTKPLFVGGHPPSFYYRELLDDTPGIDFVCVGEGEYSVLEAVRAFEKGLSFEGIKGIAYRKDGRVVFNGYRELIQDLDGLPFPARDTAAEMVKTSPYLSISICGSRGCSWASCSFCDVQSFYKLCDGKKWRGRSIKNIADEIGYLVDRFHFNKFSFVDDDFFGPITQSRERIFSLCDEIINRGLKIQFSILCNVRDIDDDILEKMKSAGLFGVFLGIESGVQRTLDTFRKGVKVEENRTAVSTVIKHGLGCHCGSILIDPYTTMDEIRENIAFWDGLGLMSIEKYKDLSVFHGTPLQKKLSEEERVVSVDYDYIYSHTLDPLVSKLNSLVEKVRDEFIIPNFNKPKKMEMRVMRMLGESNTMRPEAENILKRIDGLHERLFSVAFTDFLKKTADDIESFTPGNTDQKLFAILKPHFDDYRSMLRDLEKDFEDFIRSMDMPAGRREMSAGAGFGKTGFLMNKGQASFQLPEENLE